MTRILEAFAYSNICLNDKYFKKDYEFGKAMELVSRNEQKLLDRLGAEDKEIFEKYIDAQGEVKLKSAAGWATTRRFCSLVNNTLIYRQH